MAGYQGEARNRIPTFHDAPRLLEHDWSMAHGWRAQTSLILRFLTLVDTIQKECEFETIR